MNINHVAERSEGGDQPSELDALGPGATDEGDSHTANSTSLSADEQAAIELANYRLTYSKAAVKKQKILKQWQRLFAAWYATLPVKPPMTDAVAYCRAITKYRISLETVKQLMLRDDWQRLVDLYQESEQLRVKELSNADYQFYLDTHRRGLEMALDAEDHRAIPSFTTPMLDRILPKKEEQQQKSPLVVINLRGSAAEQAEIVMATPEDTSEAEILEISEE